MTEDIISIHWTYPLFIIPSTAWLVNSPFICNETTPFGNIRPTPFKGNLFQWKRGTYGTHTLYWLVHRKIGTTVNLSISRIKASGGKIACRTDFTIDDMSSSRVYISSNRNTELKSSGSNHRACSTLLKNDEADKTNFSDKNGLTSNISSLLSCPFIWALILLSFLMVILYSLQALNAFEFSEYLYRLYCKLVESNKTSYTKTSPMTPFCTPDMPLSYGIANSFIRRIAPTFNMNCWMGSPQDPHFGS